MLASNSALVVEKELKPNAMSSSSTNNAQATQRTSKPPPNGPTPPAPESAPSTPPPLVPANGSVSKPLTNGTHSPAHSHGQIQKGKKKVDNTVDPQAMYESLKNRIAYLEEELIHADEEEERFGACKFLLL